MTKRARSLHDDPLSAASAGLVALGIDRDRRVDVLDVLACLIDHADFSGSVVLDRELFLREEQIGVDKCLDAYALLEQLDVVSRTDNGWTITDFRWHAGPVGETEASLAVLRKHLASVGAEATQPEIAAAAAASDLPEPVVIATLAPVRRLRRAVPIAAGIAASAAVFAGVANFVPQAAVSGRNAALNSDVPTSIARAASTPSTVNTGAVPAPSPATTGAPDTTAAGPTSTVNVPAPGLRCALPSVLATVTSVEVVRLALGGGDGVWAAVVTGTATLTNSETSLVLPALNVVAHLAGGDTDAVQATLGAARLRPDKAAPFSAVVALGSVKPTETVTATATAVGMPTC